MSIEPELTINGRNLKQPGFLLANLFFCAMLFPFVSPIPITTDTQPVAAILAVFLMARTVYICPKLASDELILVAIAVFSLCYINPLLVGEGFNFFKASSFTAGIVTFIAARRYSTLFSEKVFFYSVVLYFVFTIAILFFPVIALTLQHLVVRGVNVDLVSLFQYRGIPTLSTEPGLFGGQLIFLLMLKDYFYAQSRLNDKQAFSLTVMLVFMLIMTKSGMGYTYFCGYCLIKFVSRRYVTYYLIFALLLLSIVYLLVDLEQYIILLSSGALGRGAQILVRLNDLSGDTSTLGRCYDFIMGFLSLAVYPFGNGVNGLNEATLALTTKYELLSNYYGVTAVGLVSGTAVIFVMYGIAGLAILTWLYFFVGEATFARRLFSFIFLSISFSVAFPAVWLLLALPAGKGHCASLIVRDRTRTTFFRRGVNQQFR